MIPAGGTSPGFTGGDATWQTTTVVAKGGGAGTAGGASQGTGGTGGSAASSTGTTKFSGGNGGGGGGVTVVGGGGGGGAGSAGNGGTGGSNGGAGTAGSPDGGAGGNTSGVQPIAPGGGGAGASAAGSPQNGATGQMRLSWTEADATGIGTASHRVQVRVQRAGTGIGTGSSSRLLVLARTASATGIGTASSAKQAAYARSATATGIGTASGRVGLGIDDLTPAGGTPDWPITTPTKSIAGTVRNHETGAVVAGATVTLIRDSDGLICDTTTTDVAGAYTFPRDTADPYSYHVEVFVAGSPQTHGISDNGLLPS